MKFRIEGEYFNKNCFPGLNDLLHEATRHPQAYGKMKKQYEFIAINAIRRDLRGWKATGYIIPHFKFGERLKGKKRDYDNIVAGGRKIILDAMTKAKVIEDDSPQYLDYGTNEFVYTDKPFIEVELEEVINEQT